METIIGVNSMAKFKIIGVDRSSRTSKTVYIEASSKEYAMNQAYHIPLYIPIKAIEIDDG